MMIGIRPLNLTCFDHSTGHSLQNQWSQPESGFDGSFFDVNFPRQIAQHSDSSSPEDESSLSVAASLFSIFFFGMVILQLKFSGRFETAFSKDNGSRADGMYKIPKGPALIDLKLLSERSNPHFPESGKKRGAVASLALQFRRPWVELEFEPLELRGTSEMG